MGALINLLKFETYYQNLKLVQPGFLNVYAISTQNQFYYCLETKDFSSSPFLFSYLQDHRDPLVSLCMSSEHFYQCKYSFFQSSASIAKESSNSLPDLSSSNTPFIHPTSYRPPPVPLIHPSLLHGHPNFSSKPSSSSTSPRSQPSQLLHPFHHPSSMSHPHHFSGTASGNSSTIHPSVYQHHSPVSSHSSSSPPSSSPHHPNQLQGNSGTF